MSMEFDFFAFSSTGCAKSFATNPTNRVKSDEILVASIEFVLVLYHQVFSFTAN